MCFITSYCIYTQYISAYTVNKNDQISYMLRLKAQKIQVLFTISSMTCTSLEKPKALCIYFQVEPHTNTQFNCLAVPLSAGARSVEEGVARLAPPQGKHPIVHRCLELWGNAAKTHDFTQMWPLGSRGPLAMATRSCNGFPVHKPQLQHVLCGGLKQTAIISVLIASDEPTRKTKGDRLTAKNGGQEQFASVRQPRWRGVDRRRGQGDGKRKQRAGIAAKGCEGEMTRMWDKGQAGVQLGHVFRRLVKQNLSNQVVFADTFGLC